MGGTAGALLTGVFANAELISSHPAGQVLAEQGRAALVLGQLQAVLVAYGLAAIGTFLIAGVLRGLGVQFRVTEEAENLGVDVAEHGEEAYAERNNMDTSNAYAYGSALPGSPSAALATHSICCCC